MNIEVNVKSSEIKPIRIENISKGTGFQITQGPNHPIFIMDSWDDDYNYAIDTAKLRVQTLNKAIMVYPVQIKSVKLEIELV